MAIRGLARVERLERRVLAPARHTGCAACDHAAEWPLIFHLEGSPEVIPTCPVCGGERGDVCRIVELRPEDNVLAAGASIKPISPACRSETG